MSFVPNNWYNLKPETTSVLLGYNNFWQLNANLDYFTRHINSPFMHLWYMAILLQFDFVFPLIYFILNKLGKITKKIVPCILTLLGAIVSYLFFCKESLNGNIMIAYYNTFYRLFSLLFGVTIGLVHTYYRPLILNKIKEDKIKNIIFYIYILVLITLFILVDASSKYFEISMIITTIISLRLIDYGTIFEETKSSIFDKIIKFLSKISYEVYLIQYPIIFVFQNVDINNNFKILSIIVITFILAYVINFSINIKKEDKKIKSLKIVLCSIITLLSLFGMYKYIIAKDYTSEMKELEKQLEKNRKQTKKKEEDYALKLKEEQDKLQEELNALENDKEKLKEIIKNLPIVGIGDSIMLGASDSLYEQFPNGYFDAATSRTDWEANDILINLKNRGLLSDVIVFNLGTNGECPDDCKTQIMNTVGDRKIFWVNATHPDFPIFNTNLLNLSNKYNNITIVDWISASNGHPEYVIADGIHLTSIGAKAYAKTIYDAIYNSYLEDLEKKKEEKLNQYKNEEEKRITFIGNDLLLNAYEYLQNDFSDSEFISNKDFTYKLLKDEIENKINNKTLSHNIVLVFDKNLYLNEKEYKELIELCKDYNIYILKTNKDINLEYQNVNIIDFYSEINKNNNYLMIDKVHLTNEGNNAMVSILKERIIG